MKQIHRTIYPNPESIDSEIVSFPELSGKEEKILPFSRAILLKTAEIPVCLFIPRSVAIVNPKTR